MCSTPESPATFPAAYTSTNTNSRPASPASYNLTRLVHCEMFAYPGDAIQREKEIKGWVRSKKIKLIESTNPHWHDLAADWENLYKPVDRRQADPRQILPGLTATQDDVKELEAGRPETDVILNRRSR